MSGWYLEWRRDLAVRAIGVASAAAAWLAIAGLNGLHHAAPSDAPGALAYVLAAISFLGSSLGTALMLLGRHIFDTVEISSRWQYRPRPASIADDATAREHPNVSGMPHCWTAPIMAYRPSRRCVDEAHRVAPPELQAATVRRRRDRNTMRILCFAEKSISNCYGPRD